MRWVSFNGEFAFLSFGGIASGIIAIGGTAHGVIAIGGIASAGVISIGMNAIGSVAAIGMNTVAPISLSLINGLGIYTLAGVNGWGAWSNAGTNSSGLSGHGGVNTDYSVIPAVLVIVILVIASSLVRGARRPRVRGASLGLREFTREAGLRTALVRARLARVSEQTLVLADGREQLEIRGGDLLLGRATLLYEQSRSPRPWVIADLERIEEIVPMAEETSYRERVHETKRFIVRCVGIERAPEPESRLPEDSSEVQWIIAWTARLAVVASIALLVWRVRS